MASPIRKPVAASTRSDAPTFEPVTEIRSTWLRASLVTLEARGHLSAYTKYRQAAGTPALDDALLEPWLPIEAAISHYAACEALGLSDEDLFAIGYSLTSLVHRSYFSLALHLVKTAGATPWHVLETGLPQLWKRIWRGGGLAVVPTGPKDARVDLFGWPLSRFRYCRRTTRGVGQVLCEIFAQKVYSHEVPLRNPDTLSYTFYWV